MTTRLISSVVLPEVQSQEPPQSAVRMTSASGGKVKVLLVDDSPSIRRRWKVWLEEDGFLVCVAADGVEGLAFYGKEKPAVVVTDYQMPNMGGLTMAGKIKESDPKARVILVSASTEIRDHLAAHPDPAVDVFLLKPFKYKEDLLPEIRRLSQQTN